MALWESAAKSLPGGVVLGERAVEREEDRKVRQDALEQRKKEFELQNTRAQELHDARMEEYDEKKEFKKIKSSFDAYHAMYTAGVENDDMNMQRSAAAGLVGIYNNKLPNGDEVKLIFKGDSAGNPELAQKWDSDPKLKGKEVAVLSKSGGIMPFRNLDDVFKFAASGLNMENFTAGRKQAELKIAEMNAKEEPFTAEDGNKYLRTWKLGPGGMPEKGPVRALSDVEASQDKESPAKKKLREAETVLGGKPSKGERRILAGVASPEGETAAELHRAQAARARKEGKGEDAGKQRDQFKKDLDLVLRPFAAPGKQLLDEDGELNNDGHVALDAANKLIEKADNEPDKMTKEEKRKVVHARRAWEIYEKISGHIAAGYGVQDEPTEAEIAAEAKRRGLVKDPKTGKWVKPKKGGVTQEF